MTILSCDSQTILQLGEIRIGLYISTIDLDGGRSFYVEQITSTAKIHQRSASPYFRSFVCIPEIKKTGKMEYSCVIGIVVHGLPGGVMKGWHLALRVMSHSSWTMRRLPTNPFRRERLR